MVSGLLFSIRRGLLKKVHLGGGPPVTICSVSVTPLGADWGDDGYIVYAERERGLLRVSAAGGEPELWLDNEGMVIAYPELLGDGRVLFSSLTRDENGDAAQIILASPATSERRSLNLGGSQPRYLASGHLVFADQGQLVAVAFDANKQEVRGRVALVDGIAIASGTAAAQFAVSDSGTLVYLDYLASLSRRLVWVDRDGNTSSAQAGSRAYSDIRFSLDGRRVAVHDHGAGNDIWIYSPERGTATRMSYSPLADEVPVWSPDGRFVVYTTDNGMGRILKRAPSDGSGSEEALWGNGSPYARCGLDSRRKGARPQPSAPRDAPGHIALELGGRAFAATASRIAIRRAEPTARSRRKVDRVRIGRVWRVRNLRDVVSGSRCENMSSPRAEGLKSYGPRMDASFSTAAARHLMAVKVESASEFRFETPVALFSDPFDRSGRRQPHVLRRCS